MNTENLDDPRARELTRIAHKAMQISVSQKRKRLSLRIPTKDLVSAEQRFRQLRDEYAELLSELEKEEKLTVGWRNAGE